MNVLGNRTWRGRRGAFTLIELLVVIATLAILMGLLLPAIRAIRRQGRNTKCLHHVGQCAYAVQLYLEEYRGYCMPWIPTNGCYCTPQHGNIWHTSIHFLIQEYYDYDPATGRTSFWECPGDDTHDCWPWDGHFNGSDRYTGTRRGCGYHYNNGGGVSGGGGSHHEQGLSSWTDPYKTCRHSDDFTRPSKKIATFCWCAHNFWSGAGPGRERLQWWHSDPPNFLAPMGFLDGHTSLVHLDPYKWITPEYEW